MLLKLLDPSILFKSFVLALHLTFNKPQWNHLLQIGEALIVTEGKKNLTALNRCIVNAPAPSSVADFFHNSPWEPKELMKKIAKFNMDYLLQKAQSESLSPELFVLIDDSITRKDKGTKKLEAVDWVHDHSGPGKGQTQYCKGATHVSCRIQVGAYSMPFTYRLYLREKTVRRLNRQRSKTAKIRFKSKNTLAREILNELKIYVPDFYKVYVLFDSWYSSKKLIKFIRRHGWHVISAIKSNRIFNGISLKKWSDRLKHKRYEKIHIAADSKCYFIRRQEGRMKGISEKVCVIISKRHSRDSKPKYFLSTDVNLTSKKILNYYSKRWAIEVSYWYQKNYLGLGDFRVQPYKAIDKWYAIVFLVLSFLTWRKYESKKPAIKSIADVIRCFRQEKEKKTLIYAFQRAKRGAAVEDIITELTRAA